MATFDDAARQRISGARAACNTLLQQGPVTTEDRGAVWRAEDIFAIQEALFPCDGLAGAEQAACVAGRDQIFHLTSQQNMICAQDLGPEGNRFIANLIDDACEDKFLREAPGASDKCDALYRFYEKRAAAPDFFSGEGVWYYGKEGAKWTGIAVGGGYAAGWGFAHAAEVLKAWKSGGGPKGPMGGAGAGGGGSAPAEPAPPEGAPGNSTRRVRMEEPSSGPAWWEYALAGAAIVGLGIVATALVLDDATGVGAADDPLLVPIGAAMARAAAVFAH